MSSKYNHLAAIVALCAGLTFLEIINFLQLPKTTVYQIPEAFSKSEEAKRDLATSDRKKRMSHLMQNWLEDNFEMFWSKEF